MLDHNVTRFSIQDSHHVGSRHLNVNALSRNPVSFLEKDEHFGSDVMEQEDQPGVTPIFTKSNFVNEVIINLFTL